MRAKCIIAIFSAFFAHSVWAGETSVAQPDKSHVASCIPEFKKALGSVVAEGSCPITVTLYLSDRRAHRVDMYDYFLIEERDVDSVLHELDEPSEESKLTFTINVYWSIMDDKGELNLWAYYLIARPVEGGEGVAIQLSEVLPTSFKGQIPSRLEAHLELKRSSNQF